LAGTIESLQEPLFASPQLRPFLPSAASVSSEATENNKAKAIRHILNDKYIISDSEKDGKGKAHSEEERIERVEFTCSIPQ
jgi:hypothetical protein